VKVTVTCGTADAAIYYTLDGTDPAETSMPYTQPLYLKNSAQLKVRGFKASMQPSEIALASFTINPTGGVASYGRPSGATHPSMHWALNTRQIEIVCEDHGRTSVFLTGLEGRQLYSNTGFGPACFSVSMEWFPAGMYMLSLKTEKAKYVAKVVLK
jgi:hypothetical protein